MTSIGVANFPQESRSIEEFYSHFSNLWTKCTKIIYASISPGSLEAMQAVHDVTRDQFLVKLRTKFEFIRSSLMNRESLPTLDDYLGELLR